MPTVGVKLGGSGPPTCMGVIVLGDEPPVAHLPRREGGAQFHHTREKTSLPTSTTFSSVG